MHVQSVSIITWRPLSTIPLFSRVPLCPRHRESAAEGAKVAYILTRELNSQKHLLSCIYPHTTDFSYQGHSLPVFLVFSDLGPFFTIDEHPPDSLHLPRMFVFCTSDNEPIEGVHCLTSIAIFWV